MTEGLHPTMKQPNPWIPMTDPIELAKFGKFAEELGELMSAVSRCMIQGLDESHPTTGKSNRDWLKEEMADVLAGFVIIQHHMGITARDLDDRITAKVKHLKGWHELIEQRDPIMHDLD